MLKHSVRVFSMICGLFLGTAMPVHGQNLSETSSLHADEPIRPIPLTHEIDPKKVTLGDRLFHETLLSGDDSVSCASCHIIDNYGVDNQTVSAGIKGQTGTVNSPTVMNSRFNFAQFWDGRAANLQEQAKGPVTNPIEMGAVWSDVIAKLEAEADYVEAFEEIYEDGITEDTITDAIRHYEYTLNTVNSPFDQYLRGDNNAITAQQKRGYSLFKEFGCVACHQGINVGGNMYQRMGAFIPYFTKENTNSQDDLGRYNVTKNERDLHVFKVPSLRVATHTAPYFHDGSVATLEEAINIMARYQLGHDITLQENKDIQAFIASLSGEYVKGSE